MDVAGAIAQLFAYDAYGQAIGFNPADALTEFLYSGEQFDAKIGQQYLRARYYDPATGRFNRLDPFFGNLNDPQSLHNYLYCHADPIKFTDPNGELAIIPILFIMGIVFFAFPRTAHAPRDSFEAPPSDNSWLSDDQKTALEMCGPDLATRSALFTLFDRVQETPYPYFSNNKCHEWMTSFLSNYPQYNGLDVKKIELANGAIVLEPLTVPAYQNALDYSTLNNGENDIVLTYHSILHWYGRYANYRGFSDHAIVRVYPFHG